MLTEPVSQQSEQLERLRAMLVFLKTDSQNEFYKEKLSHFETADLQNLTDIAHLPFTTKWDLVEQQNKFPPFGLALSYPLDRYLKFHQTSGTTGRPLKVLDTAESWDWWARCWVQVYRGAGVNETDRVFMAFSFGPFIGFWAAYEGARHLGAMAIPGGGMDTEQRLATILDLDVSVICCTPSYALHMAEVAEQQRLDIRNSAVKALILAGEPGAGIPTVRQRIEQAWGAKCYDHAGASEIGAYGYSCQYQTGIHIYETEFIAEVLDRDTDQPVRPGESGELVITNLGRWGYPVIRYRTGDVVRLAANPCPCGDSTALLEGGIIGRTDNMIIVRGVNIFPSSVETVIREVFETSEFRLIFYREEDMDQLAVQVEVPEGEKTRLSHLASLLRQRLALRIPVEAVPFGSLPRFQLKARRIVDRRPKL